jgi:hypothetical protein
LDEAFEIVGGMNCAARVLSQWMSGLQCKEDR